MKILYLEDSEKVQGFVAGQVKSQIDPAYNLIQAIELYDANRSGYGIIISDINLDMANPDNRQGLDFIRYVRSNNPRVPIFVYSDRKLGQESLYAGATKFFEKRGQFRDLVDRVNQTIGEKCAL